MLVETLPSRRSAIHFQVSGESLASLLYPFPSAFASQSQKGLEGRDGNSRKETSVCFQCFCQVPHDKNTFK